MRAAAAASPLPLSSVRLLSPSHHKAFGYVVHFMESNNAFYGQRPVTEVLDEAFVSMQPDAARYCFHNCGYH